MDAADGERLETAFCGGELILADGQRENFVAALAVCGCRARGASFRILYADFRARDARAGRVADDAIKARRNLRPRVRRSCRDDESEDEEGRLSHVLTLGE